MIVRKPSFKSRKSRAENAVTHNLEKLIGDEIRDIDEHAGRKSTITRSITGGAPGNEIQRNKTMAPPV